MADRTDYLQAFVLLFVFIQKTSKDQLLSIDIVAFSILSFQPVEYDTPTYAPNGSKLAVRTGTEPVPWSWWWKRGICNSSEVLAMFYPFVRPILHKPTCTTCTAATAATAAAVVAV